MEEQIISQDFLKEICQNTLKNLKKTSKIDEINLNNRYIWESQYRLAHENIPEMLMLNNLLFLEGMINDQKIKILVDTGCQKSVISYDTINKLNMDEYIDKENKTVISGVGFDVSVGNIWYLELKINNIELPISCHVNRTNFNGEFDMIIGVDFFCAYNAQINFKKRSIMINDKYEFKFI